MSRLDLSHLRQCSERWDEMEPTGDRTRLCAACERHIVDFRGLSERQIFRLREEGPVCGAYTDRQLRRYGVLPPRPRRWRAVALALGLAGTVPAANAQTYAAATEQTPEASGAKERVAADPGDDRMLRGVVLDPYSHEPLPGASVVVHPVGKTDPRFLATSTNVDGEFAIDLLALQEATSERHVHLTIRYIGYGPTTIPVDTYQRGLTHSITMNQEPGLTEFVVRVDDGPRTIGGFFRMLKRGIGL